MYSLGCIIYELFTLNEYHTDKLSNDIKLIDNIYDPNWQKLLDSLLIVDINKRFDINQVNDYILNNLKISFSNENQIENYDDDNDKNKKIKLYVTQW